MLKHALAIFTIAAAPALAADAVAASHQVRFDQISFQCGEVNKFGKTVRFIHATPPAKYIPEEEPAATDPLAKSWVITYRIICEGGWKKAGAVAHLSKPLR